MTKIGDTILATAMAFAVYAIGLFVLLVQAFGG